MNYPPQTTRRGAALRRGFTLVELLVVMAIIAIVIGIAVPLLGRMTDVTRGDAGVTAVSTAVNAARIVGGRTPIRQIDSSGFAVPMPAPVKDEGAAALFTPSGEIRLVTHDPYAQDQDGSYLEENQLHGYEDIPGLNYVNVPRSARFAGVRRADTGDLQFVPPPFAVRFDASGKLRSGGFIYYDGDGEGFDTTPVFPPSDYDPADWDARDQQASPPPTSDGRSALPFDQVPVVTAVVLFDTRRFRESGVSWADPSDWSDTGSDLHGFLSDPQRTRAIYFSPLTGRMVRGLGDRR